VDQTPPAAAATYPPWWRALTAQAPLLITCVIPMYRNAAMARRVIDALEQCMLPPTHALRIVVVDDSPGDGSSQQIATDASPCVTIVTNERNLGRSIARNRGAQIAEGELLLFLDSDCIPETRDFLAHHLAAMKGSSDISVGSIVGIGGGFWDRYQCEVAARRSALAQRDGALAAATSPNFMIRREAFLSLGGFDEAYEGYGFEDRDFFLRAKLAGLTAAWAGDAVAVHADTLELPTLCRKMHETGGAPSRRFAEAHPSTYAGLGYAAVDARRRPWLRPLAPVAGALSRAIACVAGKHLDHLPFAMGSVIVRCSVAASFLHGSALDAASRAEQGQP
jgi:GT2 family glycosyltransferase